MEKSSSFDVGALLRLGGTAPAHPLDLAPPPRRVRLALWVQMLVGRALLLPFGGFLILLLRYVGGYRIENMREMRARYRALAREKTPLLICSNHLTFIDSALMIWSMGSNPWYLWRFRAFAWNLPAGDFFKKKWRYRLVAYLNKCIFIHRDGTREHKHAVLAQCRYLLEHGHAVCVFPEGRRSRLGRFDRDNLTYGVGKILTGMKQCRVLCIYVRGDKQEGFSNYPPRGSRFRLMTEVLTVAPGGMGRDACGEITGKIGDTLFKMEQEYFAQRKTHFDA